MKLFRFLFCLSMTLLLATPAQPQIESGEWQKISTGVLEAHFGSIATASVTPQIIFLDSQFHLYRTLDEGRHWAQIFSLSGDSKSQIHRVYSSPHQSGTIYIVSSKGLYGSKDLGNHFELIFTSAQENERDCHSLAFHPLDPDILFLGTRSGIFWSWDGGESWNKESVNFANQEMIKILTHPSNADTLLVLTPSRLISINERKQSIKTLYTAPGTSENPDDPFAHEISEASNRLNDVTFVPENKLLLATKKGVLVRLENGNSWTYFPMRGLKSDEVTKIISTDSGQIFAATKQGVYEFMPRENRWESLEKGLAENDANDLAYHSAKGGSLFTVTSAGAYQLSIATIQEIEKLGNGPMEIDPSGLRDLNQYLRVEPGIRDLHLAAVRNSDLSPQKIARWQKESRLSHLFPKLSAGLKRDQDQNIDIDRAGSNQPDVFIQGPDKMSWSKNISISWDLADLIWSDSQTSIDSRSKLMTELRNEILSDLTRLYFERRRLVTEYFLKTPPDTMSKLDLIQRIDELTAHIDAYTGGYFSKVMERKHITPPWNEYETPDSRHQTPEKRKLSS